MVKVKCTWKACEHNKEGYCSCDKEISLVSAPPCGECDFQDDYLVCANFVWRKEQ